MPLSRVSDVLRLRELALRRWLPFHRLRRAKFASWFALSRRRRRRTASLRETVLFPRSELVNDGYLDVAGSSLALDRSVSTADCSFAFPGKHDSELVAKVVLEVYQPGVWVDLLRSCVFLRFLLVEDVSLRWFCFDIFISDDIIDVRLS